MLEIKETTKNFSAKHRSAISSVTFEVWNGEIVGFVRSQRSRQDHHY